MSSLPETKRILLLEPDAGMRGRVGDILTAAGCQVDGVAGARAARERHRTRHFDAVIASVGGRDRPTLGIEQLKRWTGATPLLVLCDPERIRQGIGALRRGADDYLLRPPDPFELRARLERIVERYDLDSRIAFFRDELSKKVGPTTLEVRSPAMRGVLDRILRVAPMRSTVLVYGESGVGKELVARSIHMNSPRLDHAFIALNCAAIPASLIESELFGHEKGAFTGAYTRSRGKFEIAHRGTLFLDEIGEMAPATQAKLLRVLDDREFMRIGGDQSIRVDVRVIAATNADLQSMVSAADFRQDLYYRLNVVTITVPPLRERRLDVPVLAETFLEQLSKSNAIQRKSISAEALAALQEYSWPGNVRELKNLVESLLVLAPGQVIGLEHLPRHVRRDRAVPSGDGLQAGATLAEMERELIRLTLEETGGNRTHSAAMLGIGVRTLQRKIRTYGLSIPSRRRRARRRLV